MLCLVPARFGIKRGTGDGYLVLFSANMAAQSSGSQTSTGSTRAFAQKLNK